jgi:hypothetical protein
LHCYNFWNRISSSQYQLKVWNLLVTVDKVDDAHGKLSQCLQVTFYLFSIMLSMSKYCMFMLVCPLQGKSGTQWTWNIRYGGFLHCCIYLGFCSLKTVWPAESMIDLTQLIHCKSSALVSLKIDFLWNSPSLQLQTHS